MVCANTRLFCESIIDDRHININCRRIWTLSKSIMMRGVTVLIAAVSPKIDIFLDSHVLISNQISLSQGLCAMITASIVSVYMQ